jgi:hypothetical protein
MKGRIMKINQTESKILELVNQYPAMGFRQVASTLGCDYKEVIDTLYKHAVYTLADYQTIIAPKVVNNNNFKGDGIITADHHNPCVDLNLVDQVIEHGKEFNIKRLFDIGDFFNFDAISNYARKIGGDDQLPKLTDELDFGYGVLSKYCEWFDEIYMLIGNHEGRYSKALSNALSYSTIVDAFRLPEVKVLETNYIHLDDLRLTHPRSYSQLKLSVPRRLTNKFMEPVFNAHGHFGTWGFADNGLPCGDIPCMCDPDRIFYLQGGDTTHPMWNKGFIVYKDGQIYPRAKRFGLR